MNTSGRFARYLPLLRWLPGYTPGKAASDALAAVVVSLLLIPQALAYALLAGMPPAAGLYASMLPLLAYAVWGTSRSLAVGPFAVVAIMTAVAVDRVVADTGVDYGNAVVLLALLSGLMLIAMGALKLGFMVNFLSHPVISGFISASAVFIAVSQLGHLLGISTSGQTLGALTLSLWRQHAGFDFVTLALGIGCFAWLFAVRRFMPGLIRRLDQSESIARVAARGGPVSLVIVATAASAWLHLDTRGVAVVGAVRAGLPAIGLPEVSWELLAHLWTPALLISVVAFAETVSMAQMLAARRRERVDPDQELIGLGAANLGSALSGAFPVSASLSRSAVNDETGAATPAAGAFTAVCVALAALFLMPLLRYLPIVALSTIIVQAVLSLVEPRSFVRAWRYSRHDGTAQAVTFGLTLVAGIANGLLIGVVLSLMLYLSRTARPHSAVVGRLPGTESFRNVARHRVETDPRLAILRIDESLYFANARFLEDKIAEVVAGQPALRDLVLTCPAVNHIDISALDSLEAITERLEASHIRLHLAEVKGPVMDQLQRSAFLGRISGDVFLTTFEAWQALRSGDADGR